MATEKSITIDLTTCPICADLFDNPKSLPCLHAFCLKCLQGYFKDKRPGDEELCPMCRKKFQIPFNGLGGLQHHFFVQQLVDVRKNSSRKLDGGVPCEVCQEESGEDLEKVAVATVYCVDCRQKLCEQCSRPHKRWKGGAHQVKPLGAAVEQELIQLRAGSCDNHKVELYCYACNENVCSRCSAAQHRNHYKRGIREAAGNFMPTIAHDDTAVLNASASVRSQSEQAKQDVQRFCTEVDVVEDLVQETGGQVKRSVDEQMKGILGELQSVSSESLKQAASVEETYQLALVSMESFHAYSRELLDKGRPSDITRAACQLHDRATELLNDDVTAVKYRPPHVTFAPADVMQIKRLNFIGKLAINNEVRPGTLTHVMPFL